MQLQLRTLLAIAAVSAAASPTPAQYAIPWSTTDGGGGTRASAGPFRLSGTIGQLDGSGPAVSAPAALTGGFWAAPPAACTGDLNSDGAVNTADLVIFLSRFGSNVPTGDAADFNSDGTINSLDLVLFLSRYGLGC